MKKEKILKVFNKIINEALKESDIEKVKGIEKATKIETKGKQTIITFKNVKDIDDFVYNLMKKYPNIDFEQKEKQVIIK